MEVQASWRDGPGFQGRPPAQAPSCLHLCFCIRRLKLLPVPLDAVRGHQVEGSQGPEHRLHLFCTRGQTQVQAPAAEGGPPRLPSAAVLTGLPACLSGSCPWTRSSGLWRSRRQVWISEPPPHAGPGTPAPAATRPRAGNHRVASGFFLSGLALPAWELGLRVAAPSGAS